MAVRTIVLLGDPRLYIASPPVEREQLPELLDAIADMHDTMRAFQAEHGWGRAISAPQMSFPSCSCASSTLAAVGCAIAISNGASTRSS